ncbi:MAG: Phosphoserine phosphatase 1 [candidate division WS2 bacterium]|uniref:Alpha-ribazole phosphatase n=1 Tax=Psychracetigena formicireducens TaxID=2986056 RepID=A0A9E2F633_PSYF1|nr:Phosphoserine phosphatase 1 [Candidatus Psychracetigena formicireducens]MBT9144178.1 Phosphoserine phosphatase 1 [Candidatus Psychracetigena formicireducens]MBT9150000.1 Phosphoserine phosphatase 1 [Candidatus Psychracetigena formicireducens]
MRHGETQGEEVKRYKGTIDVPLSEKGVKQMERVAEYINRVSTQGSGVTSLKTIYTSDLSRAMKSAEVILKLHSLHSLKLIIVSELRERNFGIWEGMTYDEIKKKYPEEFRAWAENPLKYGPMGGESTLEVRERVIKVLDEIIGGHNNDIAIVAHGGVNRIIICHLLGIPLENIFRVEQDYGCLNIIEFWDKYPVIKLMNYIEK